MQATARANNSNKPVFFHLLPTEFCKDVFHVLQAVAIINLTAGMGLLQLPWRS